MYGRVCEGVYVSRVGRGETKVWKVGAAAVGKIGIGKGWSGESCSGRYIERGKLATSTAMSTATRRDRQTHTHTQPSTLDMSMYFGPD